MKAHELLQTAFLTEQVGVNSGDFSLWTDLDRSTSAGDNAPCRSSPADILHGCI